ncbi:hypothetical protein [Lonsdalea britannica]|nr:hypothetical protein [Lonsdalea britannica]
MQSIQFVQFTTRTARRGDVLPVCERCGAQTANGLCRGAMRGNA